MIRRGIVLSWVAAVTLLWSPAVEAGVLQLRGAFDQAVQRNLRIQMARHAERAAAAGVAVSEGRFAFQLGSDLEVSQRNAYNQNQGGQLRYELGVTKPFSSGTTIGLITRGSQVWGRSAATQSSIDTLEVPWQTDPFYFSELGSGGLAFTVQQALLRGGGFGANEAPIHAAEARLAAAQVGLEDQISAELRDVEIEYWQWAAAVRAIEIRRTSLDLARIQKRRTAELIRKGRQAKVDALLAEQIVAERLDGLAVAESNAATRYENLFILMGSTHAEIPRPSKTPQPFPETPARLEPTETLLATAQDQNFLLRQLRLEQQGVEYDLEATANAAWPELNARASFELVGRHATFAEAYGDAFTGGNFFWSGTITFAYPLGGNPAVAEAEQLEALLRRHRDAVEDSSRMTQLAVATARRESELALNRISLATLATHLAEEKLRAEEERYTIGRTTMQNLRLFQEDLDGARLRELQSRVNYLAAQAQLDHLLGRFLTKRGITAP